jgi:aspartate racemase
MHIGLIVGIGPAATDFYYRHLIAVCSNARHYLTLTMTHADTKTLLHNQANGEFAAQVGIYLRLTERLQQCGIEQVAVTSIAGHFCIDAFKDALPVPVINLLEVVSRSVRQRGYKRLGLLETGIVKETGFYGVLNGVEVLAPSSGLAAVHDAYVSMATSGSVTPAKRELFLQAAMALTHDQGCEAVMLAGTDLALVFKPDDDPGFEALDCAALHAAAIASAAIGA